MNYILLLFEFVLFSYDKSWTNSIQLIFEWHWTGVNTGVQLILWIDLIWSGREKKMFTNENLCNINISINFDDLGRIVEVSVQIVVLSCVIKKKINKNEVRNLYQVWRILNKRKKCSFNFRSYVKNSPDFKFSKRKDRFFRNKRFFS